MSDGQVVIDITGDASRYRAAVSSLVSSTQKQVAALGSGLQSIGKGITAAVTAPVVGIGTAAVGTAVSFLSLRESAQTAFETMLGSGEAASKMIGDLYTFAKKTPFKFDGMLESSQQLISMGMAADNVIPTLTAVGDAAAASGKGQEGFKAITTALGKMQAQGQVSQDDLWSLSDNGEQARQSLANKSGQSIEDMKKAISDGTVDANWAIQALVEGIEDGTDGMAGQTAKMGGMMGELKNTFKGACDSMTSSIRNFGLAVVGEYGTTDAESSKFLGSLTRIVQQATAIIDAASKKWSDAGLSIEPMASAVGDALEKIAGGIEKMDPATFAAIVKALVALAAAGPGLVIVGKAVSLVGAAMGPIGALASGVASAAGTLKSAAKGAGEFASGILGAALPAAKDFTRSLAHGLIPQSAFDTAKQLSTDLAYGFRDAKNDIAEAFSGVKDKSASKASGSSDAGGAKLAPIKDKGGGLTSVLGESAKNAVDTFAAKLDLSGPAEKAKGALGKVGQAAGGLAKGAVVATGVLGAAATGLLGLGLAAAAGGADLKKMADDFVSNMQQITANLPVLAEQASQILPTLVSQVVDNLPAFLSAIQQAFLQVVGILPTIMPALIDGVVQLVTALATMLVAMAPQLLDAGLQLFIALVEAFAEMVPQLTPLLPDLVSKLVGILVKNAPTLLKAGFTLFKALVSAFLQMVPQLISSLPQLISQVLSTVGSWMPSLGSAAGQLFGMIVQAVPGIAGSLLGALRSLLGPLPGAVASFAGSLASAGYNMLMGLVDGIGRAAGSVVSAAVNAVSGGVNAVLSFLGIASPSKLFRKIGVFVDEGLAKGIDEVAYKAVDAMRSMAEDVYDAADMDVPAVEVPVEFDVPDFPGIGAPSSAAFALDAALARSGSSPSSPRGRKPKEDGGESGRIVDAVERLTERVDRLDRGLGRKIADNSPDEVTISNARGARRALGVG